MTLPNEHLPLPCSLREVVNRCFTHPEPGPDAEPLDTEQLVALLKEAVGADQTPLAFLRGHAPGEGGAGANTPMLRAEDAATVEWITLAFDHWHRDYPVEAPLAETLHRLLPLAIAVALTDQGFHTPGSHSLHTLLDRLQQNAVGWQARLERAGQMLEQRVQRAVDRALRWFEDRDTDFTAIIGELGEAARRDQDRAARMVHRLEETEEAAVKTRQARREAADVINRGLASCELPMAIGEFLKGPWYDSLQLVALRHGIASQEWREISRVNQQLLQSVQPSADGRNQSNDALRRLSGELRHWLISLQHDSAAADDAIGLVEYVHLRMSHGQDLGHTHIRPLPVPGEQAGESTGDDPAIMLETGQWYLLEDDDGELRAQLSLQLEEGQHLLFTNAVGLKAFDLNRARFLQRLSEGEVRHLAAEDSFSLSLAHAAGIDDQHKLRALIEPGYRPPESETPPGAQSGTAAGQLPDPAADALPAGATEATPEPSLDPPPRPTGEPASPAGEPTVAHRPEPERQPAPAPGPPPPDSGRHAGGGTTEPLSRERELELAGSARAQREDALAPARETRVSAPTPPPQPGQPTRRRRAPPGPEMDVPMGAWLGFHDGETPIMAKLAVYDPRRDNYIFVNRRGIALRELSRSELLELIDEGLVDILETRSYFRDEVQRARERRDD